MESIENLNLIIPMAGEGKRFIRAGYEEFKPFILINDKPMIKYVTDAFPQSVRKFVITSRSLLSNKQSDYLKNHLNCNIIDIPLHNKGPAFSIFKAKDELPLSESFFISYCDHYWAWNFNKKFKDLSLDGVVYTHSGFHPHLINNPNSAFCLPKTKDSTQLREIKEKESFTDNWMEEPLSIGLFYIKNGVSMMDGITDLINRDIKVNGEFFPSLIFNYLINQNKQIKLSEVDYYIHWGVPEHLQDFKRWFEIISHEKNFQPVFDKKYPSNIVTMAGLGDRMKKISTLKKVFIPIQGEPMFRYVMNHFPSRSETIITSPATAKELGNHNVNGTLFTLDTQSFSQFDTLLSAIEMLKRKSDFFLTSCDAYGIFDIMDFIIFKDKYKPDAVIFTFTPSLTQEKVAAQHTHVSVDGNKINTVHIKSKSTVKDLGLAGFFWIKDGRLFDNLVDIPLSINNEMIIDHFFKYCVEKKYNIFQYKLDQYIHIGTPDEFLEYKYWMNNKDKIPQ